MQKKTARQSYELIRTIITKECESYLQLQLHQELSLLAPYEEIFTRHELLVPYKNYLQLFELLESLKKLFVLYDLSFASLTLQRLHRAISSLQSHYRSFQKRNDSAKAVFEHLFLYRSELLYHLNGEINRFKKKRTNKEYIQREIRLLERDKKALRYFYFKIFLQKYLRQKQTLQMRYRRLLNSYLFYFDLLIWNDAKKSTKITKRLFEMGFKELSTKAYIKHKLDLSLPYSVEYAKLQKMYRIYQ